MLPKKIASHSQVFLTFGGSFLFSLTFVHILPTLYTFLDDYPSIVYYLLGGFFCQFLLDLVSHGAAHGHLGAPSKKPPISCLGLFAALFIHAMFDGLLVSGAEHLIMPAGGHHHHHHHSHGLLSGILLHKIPATFSFIAILQQQRYSPRNIAFYLFFFALASPLGSLLSIFLQGGQHFPQETLVMAWALAVGNLLHIATTVLAEANPHHHFSVKNLLAHLAGAFFAVMAAMS